MKKLLIETRLLVFSNLLILCFAVQYNAVLPSTNGVTYTWRTRPWSSCFSTVKCGEGHRVRKVSCQDSSGFMVGDSNCDPSKKPLTFEPCFRVCDHHKHVLRWRIEEWSPCVPLVRQLTTACVGTSLPGIAHRRVSCILRTTLRVVDSSACENFWDKPEAEMACSLDCPQNCVTTRRNVSCPPHTCPSKNRWNADAREITEIIVAPTERGTPCPEPEQEPVCSNKFSNDKCNDMEEKLKRYMLKLQEWSPCQISDDDVFRSEKEVQISLRPVIGVSRRNITCITDDGVTASLSLCNVVRVPVLERQCVVPVHCLTSPWSEWQVRREGCITSDGKVYPEIRTRVRRLMQMPIGGSPCPPLFEERSVSQDLPSCYKYQWLPLEWSECEVRGHGLHGDVKIARPTCGSGLQYRNLTCIRAGDMAPVDEEYCRELRPPAIQRCKIPCRRDCQVSHWSRWGPCTYYKNRNVFETMDEGYRKRERSVVVNPSNGGISCPHLQEVDKCFEIELFSWQYGNWGNCTLLDSQATCGPGKKTRNKTCVKLSGAQMDEFMCDRHHVTAVSTDCRVPCPNDCVVSEWSGWSVCSRSCFDGKEGVKFRNKTLMAVAGEGVECAYNPKKRDYCNIYLCQPFKWTTEEWGPCQSIGDSNQCGLGLQKRDIICTKGSNRTNTSKMCRYMNKPETERKCHIPCPVDCVTTNFSNWTPCEANCDTAAVQYKRRLIIQSPKDGGKACPEWLLEERACNEALETVCLRQRRPGYRWNVTSWSACRIPVREQHCGMGFQVRNVSCLDDDSRELEPHHCLSANSSHPPSALRSCEITCSTGCILTAWTAWSPCGYAYDARRSRRRELVGSVTETAGCSLTFKLLEEEKCPAIPTSDVVSGQGDLHWMSCIVVKDNSSTAMVNGQFVGQYCGSGYKHKVGSELGLDLDYCWQDCPLDCQMSEWSDWSGCNVPCGQGFRERRREILVPANHLGRPCPEGVNKTEIQMDVCHIVCADFHWLAGGWSECVPNEKGSVCGNGKQYQSVKCLDKRTEQEEDDSRCDPLHKPDSEVPCRLHCPGECVVSPWEVSQTCLEPCSIENYYEMTRTILRHPNSTAEPCPSLVSRKRCVLNETCHEHSFVVGPWGSCILPVGALCGEGVQKAPVLCMRSDGQQVDAVQCEKNHKSSSLEEPTSKPCYIDCPLDCVMSEWSAWNKSACSACGAIAPMTRTRSTVQMPSDAGQPCPSEVEQRMPCSFKACYHWKHSEWSTCDLEDADCGYGVQHRVVECIRYDGLQVDKMFCLTMNVSFPIDGWLDPAWLVTAQEDSQEEQICYVPCPGDCIMSEWSHWSHCQKNCRIGQIVGYQTSSRKILFSPMNESDSCSSELLRTRPCWNDDCNFFRWKLKNGLLKCERRDGIVVQGGCASESPPCEHWCEKLGGTCNSSTGLCRCDFMGTSQGPVLSGPTSPPCSVMGNGPHPPSNHSAPTEIRLKYYPDDSKVSFWMYAMISIGTAFVIFVAVTVYLMCRSSLRQRSVSVERQPSMRRRVNVNEQVGDRSNAQDIANTCRCPLQN